MKYFLLVTLGFCGLLAWGGTSVGNFNVRIQPEFDFRLMYPGDWKFQAVAKASDESDREQWVLDNSRSAELPGRVSWSKVKFIIDFPASNDQELLREAIRRHPNLNFRAFVNPDFVGVTSNQVADGLEATANVEYILAEKGKVIRIENRRDTYLNGAGELDLIVSTIRRISKPMTITSISLDKPASAVYREGDRFCFKVALDVLRVTNEPAVEVRYRARKAHHLHLDSKWIAADGEYQSCGTVDASFSENGLEIESMTVSSGISGVYCTAKEKGLQCLSAGKSTEVSFTASKVENPKVDSEGPEVTAISVVRDNLISLRASDSSGISWAKLDVLTGAGRKVSQILFPKELVSGTAQFPKTLLDQGFSRIDTITVMDRVGNVTFLQAHPTQRNYVVIPNARFAGFSGLPPGNPPPATVSNFPISYLRSRSP